MKVSRVKEAGVQVITLVVNDTEADEVMRKLGHVKGHKPVTEDARRLARRLRETGASLRSISETLASAGFYGPAGKPYHAGSISAMLEGGPCAP